MPSTLAAKHAKLPSLMGFAKIVATRVAAIGIVCRVIPKSDYDPADDICQRRRARAPVFLVHPKR
jgi:hypothetical protein